ncbi:MULTISPECIES: hypothetical protein [unclassified Corallococcus]|uniref:hypothetical protein n=1 Tax=unclassified Corallococcus TaxID=2685029 RepID=UPI001A8E8D27|nr:MULTISPECIES: hypothetical protein [unclassified Corallococcus]MBN9688420.1 hypothetical protein [Corallococcus sp. NCSPR001]WAS87781.1 hypothetical protein O0N60_12560 [Corallococcus sp. NCRR]
MKMSINGLSAVVLAVALYVVPAQAQQCANLSSTLGVAIQAANAAFDATQTSANATATAAATLNLLQILQAATANLNAVTGIAASEGATLVLLPSAAFTDLSAINNNLTSVTQTLQAFIQNLLMGITTPTTLPATVGTTLSDTLALIQALPPICE